MGTPVGDLNMVDFLKTLCHSEIVLVDVYQNFWQVVELRNHLPNIWNLFCSAFPGTDKRTK